MPTIDLLLQEAKGMTDDALMEVIHYMRFLKIVAVRKPGSAGTGEVRYRKAGKYRGKGWMSDDFDMPLEDFQEYM